MSKKVKISKININIGGKDVELSLDEAQELRQILNETFGQERVIYSPPIVIDRPWYPYRHWDITWAATGGNNIPSFTLTSGDTLPPEPMLIS